jgi:hypothetical protein
VIDGPSVVCVKRGFVGWPCCSKSNFPHGHLDSAGEGIDVDVPMGQ